MTGRVGWFDLPVFNLSDAMSFYEGLFGWTYRRMDASVEPGYVMIETGGMLIGGFRRVPASRTALSIESGPILYFSVEKLTTHVARARELGATIVGLPVHLGTNRGWYHWIRDREHNLIGLWAPEN